MLAAASLVVNPIKTELFNNRKTIVGLCIGACVYAAVANKYFHYVSDAYIYGRKPENIAYRFAGEWISWCFDNNTLLFNSGVWFVALIADSLRCLEQSVRVTDAIEELWLSPQGYNSLCRERIKIKNHSFTWLPLSFKATVHVQGSTLYRYSLNQLSRSLTVATEVIAMAAFIGDFLSTFMWTPESSPRNGSRLCINIREAKLKLFNDPEGTIELMQKNENFMKSMFSSCKSTVELTTYYSMLQTCSNTLKVGNTILGPIGPFVGKLVNMAAAGFKAVAQRYGINLYTPEKSKTGSPFRNFNAPLRALEKRQYDTPSRGSSARVEKTNDLPDLNPTRQLFKDEVKTTNDLPDLDLKRQLFKDEVKTTNDLPDLDLTRQLFKDEAD